MVSCKGRRIIILIIQPQFMNIFAVLTFGRKVGKQALTIEVELIAPIAQVENYITLFWFRFIS